MNNKDDLFPIYFIAALLTINDSSNYLEYQNYLKFKEE